MFPEGNISVFPTAFLKEIQKQIIFFHWVLEHWFSLCFFLGSSGFPDGFSERHTAPGERRWRMGRWWCPLNLRSLAFLGGPLVDLGRWGWLWTGAIVAFFSFFLGLIVFSGLDSDF